MSIYCRSLCSIADSTRSGKRLPDALSKTVPIWCAVVNRAIRLRHGKGSEWDTALYTSPAAVSQQEHAQIEARLDGWAQALNESSYHLPNVGHPLRPFWITPSTSSYPHIPSPADLSFFPIICISASKDQVMTTNCGARGSRRTSSGKTRIASCRRTDPGSAI